MTASVTSFYKHSRITNGVFSDYEPDRPAAPAEGECIHFSEVFGVNAASRGGYGQVWFDGKLWPAHRLMWCVKGRELPPPPFVIRHRCHNPACVNIDHLEIGTHRDNHHDAIQAGRRPGIAMTEDQLTRIYRWAIFGFTQKQSADLIGCTPGAICQTLRGVWNHRPGKHVIEPRYQIKPGEIRNPYGRPKRYRAKVNATMNLF